MTAWARVPTPASSYRQPNPATYSRQLRDSFTIPLPSSTSLNIPASALHDFHTGNTFFTIFNFHLRLMTATRSISTSLSMSILTPYHSPTTGAMAPTSSQRPSRHDLLLLLIILFFSFSTTAFVFATLLYSSLPAFSTSQKKQNQKHTAPRKTILITGANTPLALTLARLLHAEGHKVLAADQESFPLVSPARASKAVTKFYKLGQSATTTSHHVQKGNRGAKITRFGSISHNFASAAKSASEAQLYARDIEAIVHHAGSVDLWIPCDQTTPQVVLAAAREVIIKSGGGAVYADSRFAQLGGDEAAFGECIGALDTPIKAPERRVVKTRGEIHRILHRSPKGRQYLLEKLQPAADTEKTAITNGNGTKRDSGLALSLDSSPTISSDGDMTEIFASLLLPQPTINQTYSALASRHISADEPWVLHEIMDDSGTEASTHCLIVDSSVKTFIATSSTSSKTSTPSQSATTNVLSGSGAIVSSSSALHSTLLAFTASFAASMPASTSTHLSLLFHLHETPTPTGTATIVIPRSCTTAPHPSLALLLGPSSNTSQIKQIAAAYSSAASPSVPPLTNGTSSQNTAPVTLNQTAKLGHFGLYSLPRLILDLLVLPLLNLLLLRASLVDVIASAATFGLCIVFGKEERWAWADAGAWWWEWHVAFPINLLLGVFSRR
ncbi:uncharacterized protein BDZ99DRAFT_525750 [Mytilinidion resinicola]|uniref:NAD(P)-binding protein n=1 Tax=Mytilinidion resinicola TaxID=574789 RepID=A0A6A6Y6K4_9PEZI|nr:uncharacterized protein BDZ99DRAFT_525750 [Mytilinidion resinicola]KAF2804158.1 hypothetical protein BDZ99DRAFT_525750 [Mytilinidion resinicola]